MRKKFFILLIVLILPSNFFAQNYHGITGLLQVPSAETDSAGTFRGGVSFLHKAFLPDLSYYGDGIPFNTMSYSVGFTPWQWVELSYTGTFVKMHPSGDESRPLGYYNEDRHINIKFRPLKEGKYWPAIAVGWDDAGNFKTLKFKKSMTSNAFFENLYIVGSKHFDIQSNVLGVHLAYRYYPSKENSERRGIAGGVTFRPSFYRPLRIIAEWDGVGVNAGADVLLWRHLFLQACLVHGRGFTGGISYHYTIHF